MGCRQQSRLSRIKTLRPQPKVLQARKKAELLGLRNVRFEVGDVDDLRLPAGGFDAALCSNGMIYFQDTAGALRRISAWLRPGGRLVFNTPMARTLLASTHPTQSHSTSVPAGVHCCAGLCGRHDGFAVNFKTTSVLNSLHYTHSRCAQLQLMCMGQHGLYATMIWLGCLGWRRRPCSRQAR